MIYTILSVNYPLSKVNGLPASQTSLLCSIRSEQSQTSSGCLAPYYLHKHYFGQSLPHIFLYAICLNPSDSIFLQHLYAYHVLHHKQDMSTPSQTNIWDGFCEMMIFYHVFYLQIVWNNHLVFA